MEQEARMSNDNKESVISTVKEILEKNAPSGKDLVIIRTFNAPRKAIWRAWTDPEVLRKWTGPKGFTSPFCKIDLRKGGEYVQCMRSPEGRDFWSAGTYLDIKENEKIVCTDSFADEYGNKVQASHYGLGDDFPMELTVTAIFEEENGKTKFTLIHQGQPDSIIEDARIGWNQSFDKLDEYLAELKKMPLPNF